MMVLADHDCGRGKFMTMSGIQYGQDILLMDDIYLDQYKTHNTLLRRSLGINLV